MQLRVRTMPPSRNDPVTTRKALDLPAAYEKTANTRIAMPVNMPAALMQRLVAAAVDGRTTLVSLIWVTIEVGARNPCRNHRIGR
jgi:hypothetical protein